ncbi:CGNR zinc finger domain-containing protein [Saccharibacillus brassicae]|uniref:Zinc finger CGNR domain-containing protein n=1 Tax=Saccharibacillus brassicae TaxID=2583377 RepID=A0A4Y6UYY7_SACBS|nr:CGNR zinc finger domain-containing protein [Saccharibacillus brassicae]QDH22344.1 hypothetical protein FFV09_16735 [Saccharibacillus brassicae]
MDERLLAVEVVNSMWYDHLGTRSEDRLDYTSWLSAFLKDWNAYAAPDAKQLEQLKHLRALLRDMLDLTTAGEPVTDAQLNRLNAYMACAPRRPGLIRQNGEYKLDHVPAEQNWDAFLAETALSFANLCADNRIQRVKICRNSVCKWVFYDDTKNGRRQWCSSDTCGNVARVRRHRDKH